VLLPTRIGIGMLRTAAATVAATVHAALDAGVLVFDSARAYGESERLLAEALAGHAKGARAFVVTKGGMARPEEQWRPDGRASSLRRDCETSLAVLRRPIDLYLVHAPDPRVRWATTVRALRAIADEKLARAVGVCNVTLAELDEALELAPIAAVQVGLSLLDDGPLRAGVLARCRERGLTVIAHSPLGGPRRARRMLADPLVVEMARRHDAEPATVALAALLDAHPHVAAIPGARQPDAVRALAAAARLSLDDGECATLADRFAALRSRPIVPAAPRGDGEVVMVMGLPGAGKSAAAEALAADGYERLNRDDIGGSLSALASLLDERLAAGVRRLVLDNTYVTRASRAQVLAIAARRGVPVRGIFLDVAMADAQANVVARMLAAHARLLAPEELRRSADNTALSPTALWRLDRALERPSTDEGFSSLETRPFVRVPSVRTAPSALFVTLDVADRLPPEDAKRAFVIGWAPHAAPTLEADLATRHASVALCRHGGGPPVCWCRPPLPGLVLALAHAHHLDPAASELHGTSRAHRALAAAVGARFVDAGARGERGKP
jgi:aryl-alcohol dehydrogenase-like predicted oxidoreductase/predicted kinase